MSLKVFKYLKLLHEHFTSHCTFSLWRHGPMEWIKHQAGLHVLCFSLPLSIFFLSQQAFNALKCTAYIYPWLEQNVQVGVGELKWMYLVLSLVFIIHWSFVPFESSLMVFLTQWTQCSSVPRLHSRGYIWILTHARVIFLAWT